MPHSTGVEAWDRVVGQENERMMFVLASLMGDAHTASKVLEDEDIDAKPAQLIAMRKGELKGIYDTYAKELAPQIEEHLVAEMREVAARASQLEHQIMDEIVKKLPSMSDPSRALTAVTKAKQTAIDKVLSLTGRPQVITERRDAAQLVKRLEAMRVLIPIEGSAEEV
jgi:hypothetical protein